MTGGRVMTLDEFGFSTALDDEAGLLIGLRFVAGGESFTFAFSELGLLRFCDELYEVAGPILERLRPDDAA